MAFDLARRGIRVVVWDRDPQALDTLTAEARASGLAVSGSVCDVTDPDLVAAQAALVGPIDLLINNAGVVSGKSLLETSNDQIRRTFEVNTLALFWTTKAFLPGMLERGQGHVVTVASAAGLIGVRGLADYSASKFAAVGFDEALRMELAATRSPVGTTVVCPFFIDTGMFAGVSTRFPFLLPILKPEVAARRIVRAVLRQKKRLVMPGFVNSVFWMRILPLSAVDALAGFFGINHSMDHFVGRTQEKR